MLVNRRYQPLESTNVGKSHAMVRERLGNGTASLECTPRNVRFNYPFPPKEVVAFYRQYFGPTQMTFAKLDEAGQAALAGQLVSLWIEHNTATDGTTVVEGEYLDVRAIRA